MAKSNSLMTVSADQITTIERVSGSLRALRSELCTMFPEREWLIQMIIYALMTGNNVMMYGMYGTAKSMLIRTILDAIVGNGVDGKSVEKFMIQMDPDVTDSLVLGSYDYSQMQKGGGQLNRVFTGGNLPTAHFAFFDEWYNATLAMIMALNDALNERKLIMGRQSIHLPLLTAFATTNRSPEDVDALYPELHVAASNDRWIVALVDYLSDHVNLVSMVSQYIGKMRIPPQIQFSDLQQVVEIIRNTNQFPSQEFVELYVRLLQEYRARLKKELKGVVSDRRLNILTQFVEAAAVLNGRAVLTPEDLYAIGYGLCPSTTSPQYEIFKLVSTSIVGEATKTMADNLDVAIKSQLKRIQTDVADLEAAVKTSGWNADATLVGKVVNSCRALRDELKAINPKLDSSAKVIEKLLIRVQKVSDVATGS